MKLPRVLLPLLAVLPACSGGGANARDPIEYPGCAHAHNDYEHATPLFDALDHGFCSVEVDIFLVGTSSLLVAHDLAGVDPSRSIQSLYLDPLAALAASNGGAILDGGEPLTLLIDVKSSASATWPVLESTLASYGTLLTRFESGIVTPGAVTAIVSGARDRAAMEAATLRHAAMDGRLPDLGTGAPVDLIPLVSDNWDLTIDWSGHDEIPDETRALLEQHADTAHAEGRRLRFWNTPSLRRVWREQARAGVDLLNADDLAAMEEFLDEETAPPDS